MGQRLVIEVPGGERTRYRAQWIGPSIGPSIGQLGERLATEFGRSFEAKSMRRIPGVFQFKFPSSGFPVPIVATLSRQSNWSHVVDLLPLKAEPARWFEITDRSLLH